MNLKIINEIKDRILLLTENKNVDIIKGEFSLKKSLDSFILTIETVEKLKNK